VVVSRLGKVGDLVAEPLGFLCVVRVDSLRCFPDCSVPPADADDVPVVQSRHCIVVHNFQLGLLLKPRLLHFCGLSRIFVLVEVVFSKGVQHASNEDGYDETEVKGQVFYELKALRRPAQVHNPKVAIEDEWDDFGLFNEAEARLDPLNGNLIHPLVDYLQFGRLQGAQKLAQDHHGTV